MILIIFLILAPIVIVNFKNIDANIIGTIAAEGANDNFGFAVANAGDINGDSVDDIIVGAPGYDSDRGRAYVFWGGPWLTDGYSATAANLTINGGAQGDKFGWDVASAGDFNGDGLDDIIVGAPGNNSDTGATYLFYGNNKVQGELNAGNANITFIGDAFDGKFGVVVEGAGDFNNDGNDDVIISATNYYNDWWNGSWEYRQKIIFNNSGQSENLTYFPSLVVVNSSNIDYSKARADGTDLRFLDEDGSTELNYHIEEWNTLGNSYVWVNVTEITASSSTDYIWMYYGNPSAADVQNASGTYDASYLGVWHLNETGTGTRYDSTQYGNHGTPTNYEGDEATTGKIDGADEFEDGGGGDSVDCGVDAIPDLTYHTITTWINPDLTSGDTNYQIFCGEKFSSPYNGISLYIRRTDGAIGRWLDAGYLYSSVNKATTGQWSYLAIRGYKNATAGYIEISLNGGPWESIFNGDTSNMKIDTGTSISFGNWPGPGPNCDTNGIIDEIRISNITRSEAWIRAEYLSMNNSFIGFGEEEQNIEGSGAVFIFYGQKGIDKLYISSGNANATLYNDNPNSDFGVALGCADDLNNDNFDDIIIGAPGIDRAYIYYGNVTIFMKNNTGYKSPSAVGSFNQWANATYAYASDDQHANSTITSNSKQDYCNFSFSVPDGVIIQGIMVRIEARAPMDLNSELDFFLSWNGGTTFSPYQPDIILNSHSDKIYFVGGPENTWGRTWASPEFTNENFTIRLMKKPSPTEVIEVDHLQIKVYYSKYREVIFEGTPNEGFGSAVSGGGDVDADGNPDVIIGAPLNNTEQGSAYLFSYNNWITGTHLYTYSDAVVTLSGENPGDLFGYTVNSYCKFNGDIYNDVFIGAPNASSNGKIYGFYGGTSIPSQILASNADYKVAGESANDMFGLSITSTGNFDASWYDDIIVGAPDYDNSGTTGKTYLLTYDKIMDIKWIKTYSQSGFEDTTFIAGEPIVIRTNISGPFGSYDVSYVNITITAPDSSILVNNQQMVLEQQDPHAFSVWRLFNYTFNNPNVIGMYRIDIDVVGSNNAKANQMTTYDLEIGPLHQILITPSTVNIVAGQSLNFAAQGYDEYNNLKDLTGTIWTTTVGSFTATSNTAADFSAQTKVDQGYVNATSATIMGSAVVNIIPDSIDHITVSPNEANITVGTTQNFSAVGYDKYDNIVSITPIWETNIGSMDGSILNAPTTTGSGYVNASFGDIVGSAKINITPGELDKLVITPSSVVVEVGSSQIFSVVGYDKYNNIVAIEPVWTTTVGIMDGSNLTAQTNSVSGGFVNATVSNLTASAIVTLIPGPLHHLVILPENVMVTAGNLQAFTAVGYDVYGNPVEINPIWNTNVGQMSGNILMAQITIGSGIVTASYSGINSIANVTIIPGELDYIFIVPQLVEVVVGNQQEFTAFGYDKYNNLIVIDPVWYTDIGVMVGNILYAQTVLGEGSVTATVKLNATQEDIVGIAQVNVISDNITGRPIIKGKVPDQDKYEDCPTWPLFLSPYESYEGEDIVTGEDLKWYITGANTSLFTVSGEYSEDDVLRFTPIPDAYGNNEITLWLIDSNNKVDMQQIWVNLTPRNDAPIIFGAPDLIIHFDDPYTFNYEPYIYDIETPKEGLIITTSENIETSYTIASGLNVTYKYPESMLDQEVFVRIIVSDGEDTGEDIIMVRITDDWVPKLVRKLPDITLYEGTSVNNVFDLDEYFTDPDKDALFYSFGQTHVSVTINIDHTVDVAAASEWSGTDTVTFRAEDPLGALAEDTILVIVIPVNDPPSISGVPNLVVHYDYDYIFDLSSYISDRDNELIDLDIFTSDPEHIKFDKNNKMTMIINYPKNMTGLIMPVTITVSDGLVSSWQLIEVTISDDFPPEIRLNLPDIVFDEDAVMLNVFDLDNFFFDLDGDALYYSYGYTNIIVTIDSDDKTVDFSAEHNWYGIETVTFRAEDPFGALAEDLIVVTVIPVNDAPNITKFSDQQGLANEIWVLDLSPYLYDVDNNLTDLEISVDNELVVASGLKLVFYSEHATTQQVTIEVSDGDKNSSYSFYVTFNAGEDVVKVSEAIFWGILIILIVLLCGSMYIFKKYKGSYIIEDVFLVYNDGTLLSHKTRRSWENSDEDLISAMFTAVQDFVKSSFAGQTKVKPPQSSLSSEYGISSAPYDLDNIKAENEWRIKQLSLENHDIFIERGKYVYIAVVFTGSVGWNLHFQIRKIILDINENYSDLLKKWTGDMRKLVELENKIEPLIKMGKADSKE